HDIHRPHLLSNKEMNKKMYSNSIIHKLGAERLAVAQRAVVLLPSGRAEPLRELKDTLDKDHPHTFEHEDSSYQSLAVGAYLEEAKEAKPPEIHVGPAGGGGDQIWPKPDLGVVAEEDSAFGLEDVSVGAPGTKTNEENKGYDEQDQNQPALKAAAGKPQVQDDTNLHRIYSAFSGLELSGLDCIFQCTQFPDLFVWFGKTNQLLFQRTQVQFPAPTQLFTSVSDSSARKSDTVLASLCTRKHQKVDYLLHVGPDEDVENWSGAKAPRVLTAGEGRNEETSGQAQPGQEAAAAEREGAGKSSEESPSADATGLVEDGIQQGASGGDQENEQQPREPVCEGIVGSESEPSMPMEWSCVCTVRMLVPEYRFSYHHRFTLLQGSPSRTQVLDQLPWVFSTKVFTQHGLYNYIHAEYMPVLMHRCPCQVERQEMGKGVEGATLGQEPQQLNGEKQRNRKTGKRGEGPSTVVASDLMDDQEEETMGQTATTPLSLTLSHWTDVRARAHNEGVEVRKKKWITLCEAEWDPVALTNLIESILVTHRPTWDDCQQLLQTLLTLEEKQWVVLEARKQVPGDDGRPTQLPNLIDAAFPLTRPDWDFNAPEGRDLLTKLKAQIHFGETGPTVTGPRGAPLQILTLHLEEEYRLYEPEPKGGPLPEINTWLEEFPQAWAETGGLGLVHDQPPLVIPLKASATPVSIKQYPMSREAYEGIKPPIRRLLDQGVLRPCQSPWNTPLLPVKKPGTGDYRPVQDLREVNKQVKDIHPTVPNPYNLLSTLSPTHAWYTVLDLKDAFFSLRLHPQSQLLFAFEWKDPELGLSGQLTWTRLPQGFKNSPTLFDEALHADLAEFRIEHPTLTLLQYVDDLLLAARDRSECLEGTRALLERLGQKGYRASAKKAQICQDKVTYLGYTLSGGQRCLTDARKEAIIAIPPPENPRQVREFLGTAGYCRLWIPSFAELAAPLYPLTKPGIPFQWEEEHQRAFTDIKRALLEAPALGLPDLTKPFELFVAESLGFAKGVLVQRLGPWRRPVAYLSKKLDPVASGWPPCLSMVAAIAVLVKDAGKLTLGQPLMVLASHTVEALVRQPPDRWLSNARMTHYQALLLDSDRVTFGAPVSLNPATLLPLPDFSQEHDCLQILAEAHGTRPDLTDQPLNNPDLVWYTDGSSFLENGECRAGATVTTETEVIWASALPPGTSAQRAELIALTQALRLAEGKRLTVYTDSRMRSPPLTYTEKYIGGEGC
ncbi:hypothetical protein STEG23_004262, partial [Scotinomys teguina]